MENVLRFKGRDEFDVYHQWRTNHPYGYVLHLERGLHYRASCFQLGPLKPAHEKREG